MLKRFAVVKDWENTVSAEEECIKRIVEGAAEAGYACDVVDTSYRLISNRKKITSATHDFVLHIHYCSGKAENIFSIATLWNPIKFYHNWGYRKSADTLMTNDAFVQSGSEETVRQVERLSFNGTYQNSEFPFFYPSPASSLFQPQIKDEYKLMYCGINWEKLTGKKGRFDELLKKLDENNLISIYGPEIFHGIRPWEGCRNYKGEIPFDGISMIKEIAKCGIALVISSENHIQDEIISNRLFEALAAGAIILADHNQAVKKLIGNNCLYIDTSDSEKCFLQIKSHLEWIKENRNQARELALRAQEIFNKNLSTKVSVARLYDSLPYLKEANKKHREPELDFSLTIFYILDRKLDIEKQVGTIRRSILANQHNGIRHVVISNFELPEIIESIPADSFEFRSINKPNVRYGDLVLPYLEKCDSEYFSILIPGEEAYEDHFISIIKGIQKNQALSGSSDLIVRRKTPDATSFIGIQWIEQCQFTSISGAFVHSTTLIDKQTLSTISQLSRCLSLPFVLKAGEKVASSKGFSLKVNLEVPKTSYESETLRDLRLRDYFGLLNFSKVLPVQETRLRRFYNKHYKKIVILKKYPFLWSSLKVVAKRFL